MAIPFYLVTGFLGSGKTTLLDRFLAQAGPDLKIGVVQNEFAPASVDSAMLTADPSYEILDVNNGSVFCVCLLSSFVKSLQAFLEDVRPDVLIMEASGLSDPIAVAEMLQEGPLAGRLYMAQVWCVIDGPRFRSTAEKLTRVQHQVRIADTVVLNKMDVPGVETAVIRTWVGALNPLGEVVETRYCDLPLWPEKGPFALAPVALRRASEHAGIHPGMRPGIGSVVLRSEGRLSMAALEGFLDEVLPDTLRMKGFVRIDSGEVLCLQSVGGDRKLQPVAGYKGRTELVAMGEGLDAQRFKAEFDAACRGDGPLT